jgi:hypothetical protein
MASGAVVMAAGASNGLDHANGPGMSLTAQAWSAIFLAFLVLRKAKKFTIG